MGQEATGFCVVTIALPPILPPTHQLLLDIRYKLRVVLRAEQNQLLQSRKLPSYLRDPMEHVNRMYDLFTSIKP